MRLQPVRKIVKKSKPDPADPYTRLIQVVFCGSICQDLWGKTSLAVKGATRYDAHQHEGQSGDDPQDDHAME